MIKFIKDLITGDKYDEYREEVLRRNYSNLRYLTIIGTVVILLINLVGAVFNKILTFNTAFLILAVYFILITILVNSFKNIVRKHTTLIFYLMMTPVMIMGILLGTFLDPKEPSITIMIFMCVLPVFILDKPLRVVSYILSVAVVYSVCCYISKDFELFREDMIDVFIYGIMAIGVNLFTLNDRIGCVENSIKYREKSELDLLTGVYNRGTGVEKMEELIQNKAYGAFIMIDVDDFKHVNDNYGHSNGDRVLKKISDIIKDNFYKEDIVFRMGGDEFAVYAAGLTDSKACRKKFDYLFKQLSELSAGFSREYKYSISLGCSFFSTETGDFKQLYKNSDESLYEAKKARL